MLPELQTSESQIIQHDEMVISGQTINLRARQFIYIMAAAIDKENPVGMIRINAKDFLAFVNSNSREKWSDIYKLVNDIGEHLNDNPILLRKPRSKEFRKVNWLESFGVVGGNIEVEFSSKVGNYFLYQQGLRYTKLLWDIRAYKSSATARILDLFQRFHDKNSSRKELSFEYSLTELKLFFGVHNQYPRFYDFEKRVLKTAAKELEKHDSSPYWFEYEKIKKGREVVAIRFLVHVRHNLLLAAAPELASMAAYSQMPLFAGTEGWELTNEGKRQLAALRKLKLKEDFCLRIISNLTTSQGRAYYYLVKYGVNRSLAFTLVRDFCSFGELKGVEDHYVTYSLDQLEKKRIRRIAEAKAGKTSKKRITPDSKRGGLVKPMLQDQHYFSEFMEKLSGIRREHDIDPPEQMVIKNNEK